MGDMTMERRMERLERQNRRLKAGMLVVIAVVAGLVCIAATQPVAQVVRAERFEVVDAEGHVMAVLGTWAKGQPRLLLGEFPDPVRGKVDKLQAILGITDDGMPRLDFRGSDGETRLGLHVNSNGSSSVQLGYGPHQHRAQLVVDPDGYASLVLLRRDMGPEARLGFNHSDVPTLSLSGADVKVFRPAS